MIDLITAIASAIAYSEAGPNWWSKRDAAQLPVRNHNPGDLRAVPADPTGKCVAGFAVCADDAHGVADTIHQIALDIARGQTFRQLMAGWAPAADGNNQVAYFAENLRRVKAMTGIELDPDKALLYYLPALVMTP